MTDGPHTSLKMSRAWKKAAEALSKPAFTEEADGLVEKAILKEFKQSDGETILRVVAQILGDAEKSALFSGREDALDAIRDQVQSGTLADSLIRNLGIDGDLLKALSRTLRQETAAGMRTVEDHFVSRIPLGETNLAKVGYLRDRSSASIGNIDFNRIAGALLKPAQQQASQQTSSQSGKDRTEEGPPL